jgi:hypothetical protein
MSQKTTDKPAIEWQFEFPPDMQAEREAVLAALGRAMDEGAIEAVREAGTLAWAWVARHPEDYAVWDAGSLSPCWRTPWESAPPIRRPRPNHAPSPEPPPLIDCSNGSAGGAVVGLIVSRRPETEQRQVRVSPLLPFCLPFRPAPGKAAPGPRAGIIAANAATKAML